MSGPLGVLVCVSRFSEMPTNRWVESSFWNFDALFQPQSHPARDAHDTFFLSSTCGWRGDGLHLCALSALVDRDLTWVLPNCRGGCVSYLADPAATPSIPADFLARVKDMHEHGGHGSVGYVRAKRV